MRIGIILYPYGEDKPAGLGRAIFDLSEALIRKDLQNDYIIFLKKKPNVMPEFFGKNWRVEVLGKKFFWLDRGLSKCSQADVYIFNTPILPLFYRPKKSIAIVLDFAYKYFPAYDIREYFQKIFLSWYHGFSLRRVDKIVAVSQATKKDIMRFFKIPEKKIKVVYLGFERKSQLPEQKIKTPEKFFLFVGVIKERKNILNVVKAFKEFKENHPDYKLVIVGKGQGKYFQKIKEFVRNKGLYEDVIFFGYLNNKQLAYLYRRAQALVFPSIVEGFGLPVLEAMDCGLPVITSNISSLPELANGAALLVDPYNVEEIKAAIQKLIEDKDLRNKLITKGFEQAKKFSWDKCANELIRTIQSL